MKAHPHPTAAPDDLTALAHRILAGDLSGLPRVDYETYTTDQWVTEAQAAVDNGCTEDFAWMLAEEIRGDQEGRAEYLSQFDHPRAVNGMIPARAVNGMAGEVL